MQRTKKEQALHDASMKVIADIRKLDNWLTTINDGELEWGEIVMLIGLYNMREDDIERNQKYIQELKEMKLRK